MRYGLWPLLILALLSSGCAGLIASCGRDLYTLDTKEKVQARMGKPIAIGQSADGEYEVYHSHMPTIDEGMLMSYGLTLAFTYGLAELLVFPGELLRVAHITIVGQDIQFYYDDLGRVKRVFVEDERLHFRERIVDLTRTKPWFAFWYVDLPE